MTDTLTELDTTEELSVADDEHRHMFCVCSRCERLRAGKVNRTYMIAACGVLAGLDSSNKPSCPRCVAITTNQSPDAVPCAYCGHKGHR